jgi:hypothetical protein
MSLGVYYSQRLWTDNQESFHLYTSFNLLERSGQKVKAQSRKRRAQGEEQKAQREEL